MKPMKHTVMILTFIALAFPALAEEGDKDFAIGVFTFGVGQTEIEGEVSGVWSVDDSPYLVVDSTWVPEGEELTIEAGVTVRIAEDVDLVGFGKIVAVGRRAASFGSCRWDMSDRAISL